MQLQPACMQAYEGALQQRYRDFHASLALGVRTTVERSVEERQQQSSLIRDLPALRMQVAARQQATLAAAAAARHADSGLKSQVCSSRTLAAKISTITPANLLWLTVLITSIDQSPVHEPVMAVVFNAGMF
jgi:hypothetical protein